MGDDEEPVGQELEPTLVVPDSKTIAGKYRLERLIGEGGMGSVYEAEHTGLGIKVAVKMLAESFSEDVTFVKRFRREARASAAVKHENVVSVTDTGTDEEGIPFLVMELLDGESLSSILRRERSLPPEQAADIARQVLSGLTAAHPRGIVHRDLKPANVFLAKLPGGSQRVKILDFGISKFAGQATLNVTAEGAVIGTPAYMAPEQVKGLSDLDARVDLYAVGVMLYRMCTGKLPFAGKKAREIYEKILAGEVTAPTKIKPEIPDELEEVILKAMSIEREDRFADASEFLDALREAVPKMDTTGPIVLSRSVSEVPPPRSTSAAPPKTRDGGDSIAATRRERPSSTAAAKGSEAVSTAEKVTSERHTPATKERGSGLVIAGVVGVLAIVGVAAWITGPGNDDGGTDDGGDSVTPSTDEPTTDPESPGDDPTAAIDESLPTLRYGVTEYTEEETVRHTHEPLVRFLQGKLGRRVQLLLLSDYELVGKLGDGDVDLAAMSAYRYVRAIEQHPDLRLLATAVNPGGATYEGHIVALADSDISTLEDLRGKTFCFVGTQSASGYLYPLARLAADGISERDLGRSLFFDGSHEGAVNALIAGQCSAAGVYQGAIEDMGLRPQRFRVLAATDRIPHDAYVVSNEVSAELADAIQAALLELEPDSDTVEEVLWPEGQLQGFVAADPGSYGPVREVVRALDEANH